VLLCGDYLNLINEDPAQFNDQEANIKGEAEIAILLSPLTKLNPLIPVIFICYPRSTTFLVTMTPTLCTPPNIKTSFQVSPISTNGQQIFDQICR
jgi:hypothetical protein